RSAPEYRPDGELGRVGQGARMPVTGRTANNQYVRVEYRGREGWLFYGFVEIEGDLDSVPVIEAEPGQVFAVVKTTSAPIRSAPEYRPDGELGREGQGARMPVTGRTANNQYVRVEYRGREGWLFYGFVEIEGDLDSVPVIEAEPGQVFAVVKTTSAPIRSAPEYSPDGELGREGQGARMLVTGRTANSQYMRVEYRGREGWLFFGFVEIEGDLDSVPVIEAEAEGVLVLVGSRAVIIYAAPGLYADRIETVENVELPVTGRTADGGWYRVEWQGREAWIVNSYYLRIEGDKNALPVVEEEAEVAPTPRPAAYPAGAPNADWTPLVREFNGLPMVYVPAGCFVMGSTDPQIDAALEQCRADYGPCERDWFTDEKPRSEVCLDAFWIGQTEVTNAQYQACVQAGACSPLKDRRYAGNGNHPVVSVDWFQARDYAAWVGGALPSEGQWEYAARGPQGLQYPWGEELDGNRLNYCDANCANEWRHAAYDDGYAQTAPVGSFPAGASWVGALDLSGNVWEWTSTLYREYPYRAGDGREDPASAGWGRVLRGGSWTDGRFNARAADRLWLQPSTTDFHYGFRIVMAESGPTSDAGAVEAAPGPTPTPTPTLTPANTFLGIILQTGFSGGPSEFFRDGEGWRIVSEGGEMMYCVGGSYDNFPAVYFKVPDTLRDYFIQARVRFTSASGHVALMTRLNSSVAGYRHALQWGAEGIISQYYYPADSGLGAANVSVRSGQWYTLRAEIEGDA
ncbi:MAG: formylglycine-generating enzyme family protein, partial [Anaerolineae bacterium]|nr:formylglycine-generating enzyme family protein [Anaerolineae bacterium]